MRSSPAELSSCTSCGQIVLTVYKHGARAKRSPCSHVDDDEVYEWWRTPRDQRSNLGLPIEDHPARSPADASPSQ